MNNRIEWFPKPQAVLQGKMCMLSLIQSPSRFFRKRLETILPLSISTPAYKHGLRNVIEGVTEGGLSEFEALFVETAFINQGLEYISYSRNRTRRSGRIQALQQQELQKESLRLEELKGAGISIFRNLQLIRGKEFLAEGVKWMEEAIASGKKLAQIMRSDYPSQNEIAAQVRAVFLARPAQLNPEDMIRLDMKADGLRKNILNRRITRRDLRQPQP